MNLDNYLPAIVSSVDFNENDINFHFFISASIDKQILMEKPILTVTFEGCNGHKNIDTIKDQLLKDEVYLETKPNKDGFSVDIFQYSDQSVFYFQCSSYNAIEREFTNLEWRSISLFLLNSYNSSESLYHIELNTHDQLLIYLNKQIESTLTKHDFFLKDQKEKAVEQKIKISTLQEIKKQIEIIQNSNK